MSDQLQNFMSESGGERAKERHLEVLPHLDADVLGHSKGLLGGHPPDQQAADHRQVE